MHNNQQTIRCRICRFDYPKEEIFFIKRYESGYSMYKCRDCHFMETKYHQNFIDDRSNNDETDGGDYIKWIEGNVKGIKNPRGYSNSMDGEHRVII